MVTFAKGHGTRNDFVLLDDREGTRPLTASAAAAIADFRQRHYSPALFRLLSGPVENGNGHPTAGQAEPADRDSRGILDVRDRLGRRRHHLVHAHSTLSKTAASPWPPPMHIVSSA